MGAQGVRGLMLALGGPGAPLRMPGQPDRNLGFADKFRTLNNSIVESAIIRTIGKQYLNVSSFAEYFQNIF